MKIYIVQKGDTAHEIAQKHGVSLSALRKLNTQLSEPDQLKPGMKIKVPSDSKPVTRKIVSVKKETSTRTQRSEKANPEPEAILETSEPEVDIEEETIYDVNLNSNTYTFKPINVKAPSYPFNDGEIELGTVTNESESPVPMMEDPFPDAMKEKETPQELTGSFEYGQPGYPTGYNLGENVGNYSPAASLPYNPYQGSSYAYQQMPYPTGYPAAPESNALEMPQGYPTGYPAAPESSPQEMPQGYPNASQEQGYYGYTPVPPAQGYPPYRNTLGCQAEAPYSASRDYPPGYGVPFNEGSYPYYGEYSEPSNPAGVPTEGVPSYYENPFYNTNPVQYGYGAPEEGPAEGYGYSQAEPHYSGYPGGYPLNTSYNAYPSNYGGTMTQPYSGYGAQNPPNTMPYSTYPGYQGGPAAPDYSMWESYVDYHEPPYQPDFPIKPNYKSEE